MEEETKEKKPLDKHSRYLKNKKALTKEAETTQGGKMVPKSSSNKAELKEPQKNKGFP